MSTATAKRRNYVSDSLYMEKYGKKNDQKLGEFLQPDNMSYGVQLKL